MPSLILSCESNNAAKESVGPSTNEVPRDFLEEIVEEYSVLQGSPYVCFSSSWQPKASDHPSKMAPLWKDAMNFHLFFSSPPLAFFPQFQKHFLTRGANNSYDVCKQK